jgi:16S rRNA G966 N2-methylase RsmD
MQQARDNTTCTNSRSVCDNSTSNLSRAQINKKKNVKGPVFTAFITGIPRFKSSRHVRRSITPQLKKYRFKQLVIDHNCDGHARGYAWVYFADEKDRDHCCEEMSTFSITIPIPRSAPPVAALSDNLSSADRSTAEVVDVDGEEHEMINDSPGIVVQLRLQPCLSNKLCMAWPFVTQEQRQLLKLDPEAYYSITDGYSAKDTCDIISCFLDTLNKSQERSGIAVDCTAGAGGNATSLVNSGVFKSVTAVEVHTARYNDLVSNMHVVCGGTNDACSWKALNADSLEVLFYPTDETIPLEIDRTAGFDLLYFDPPWGGQEYKDDMGLNTSTPKIPSDYELKTSGMVPVTVDNELFAECGRRCEEGGDDKFAYVALSRLLGYECSFGSLAARVKLAVMKVPSDFDSTAFCRRVTSKGPWTYDTSKDGIPVECRPHPFRFQVGARSALIVIAYPHYFRNQSLNEIMPALASFDSTRGEEFHPRFFDWEKEVWISCRRWRGF